MKIYNFYGDRSDISGIQIGIGEEMRWVWDDKSDPCPAVVSADDSDEALAEYYVANYFPELEEDEEFYDWEMRVTAGGNVEAGEIVDWELVNEVLTRQERPQKNALTHR